jgi:hypothetical protein
VPPSPGEHRGKQGHWIAAIVAAVALVAGWLLL